MKSSGENEARTSVQAHSQTGQTLQAQFFILKAGRNMSKEGAVAHLAQAVEVGNQSVMFVFM